MMRLVADYTVPAPYPVTLIVRCDNDHGLFGEPTASFDASKGHPRDPAIRAGWKFTADGVVLCPACARRA